MKKALLVTLCLIALGVSSVEGASTKEKDTVDVSKYSLKKLKADIVLLNLINGLNLTPKQMQIMYGHANHYKYDIQVAQNKKLQTYAMAQKSLQKIYLTLLRGNNPAPHSVKGLRMAQQACQKADEELQKAKIKHRWGVQAILNDQQKEAVRHFKACLLPPKDFKDPVRVGQAMNLSGQVEFMQRYREAGPVRRERMEERMYERLRKVIVRKTGIMDEGLLRTEVARMKATLKEAVKLNKVQFELKKNKLAEDLAFHNPHEKLRKDIIKIKSLRDKTSGQESTMPQIDILLQPNVLAILEVKFKNHVSYKKGSTDLKKIEGAKGCDKCSVD